MTEQTQQCPDCGSELQPETNECVRCDSNQGGEAPNKSAPPADYGIVLMAIPLVATLLIWFWVGSMALIQGPSSTLGLILVANILGTAGVATLEASKAGMTANRQQKTYSPTAWFFIIVLLWIVGYPMYLYKRAAVGLANRLVPGIIIACVFLGSWGIMYAAIEAQMAEIRADFEQFEYDMEELEREWDLMEW